MARPGPVPPPLVVLPVAVGAGGVLLTVLGDIHGPAVLAGVGAMVVWRSAARPGSTR
ncbi:hypothetical protein ACI782_04300 [Geodermatophilus sp. SYSU D00703]